MAANSQRIRVTARVRNDHYLRMLKSLEDGESRDKFIRTAILREVRRRERRLLVPLWRKPTISG